MQRGHDTARGATCDLNNKNRKVSLCPFVRPLACVQVPVKPVLYVVLTGRVLTSGVRIRGGAILTYGVTLEDVSPSYL